MIHDFEAGLAIHDLKRYEAEMVPVKLAIDQWYLGHASPLVDLLVLLALVQRFVLRRPVTTLHHRLEREIPEVADLLDRHRASPGSARDEPGEERVPARSHVRPRRRVGQAPAGR